MLASIKSIIFLLGSASHHRVVLAHEERLYVAGESILSCPDVVQSTK